MNRAALLALTSAAFLASCSTDNAVTGPFSFSGSCDVFDVTDTTLDTDPAAVTRLEVVADCDMGSEIGMTGTIFDFVITNTNGTLAITGESFYSTSQTDILVGEFEGTGTVVSASTFNFQGTEEYSGGVGDFENTTGSSEISGGVITITAPGSGGWTVVGQID